MSEGGRPRGLRAALRAAAPLAIDPAAVGACLTSDHAHDALFARAWSDGLASLDRAQRSGALSRVTGEVAEAVAELLLDEIGYRVFWHITTPGVHGVDLLFLSPDESVLALEVKGTLRPGLIPRLTPSRARQMSREWLNSSDNPAMQEWDFEADDLYAGVMVVDFASTSCRFALSGDFELYVPISTWSHAADVRWLDDVERAP